MAVYSLSFGSRSICLSFQDIQNRHRFGRVRCCVEPNQNRIGHLAEQGRPAWNPCSSTAPLYPENTEGAGVGYRFIREQDASLK